MKLRNKETGEEGYLYANKNENYNVLDADDKVLAVYSSLAKLNEKWEDYEELDLFKSIGTIGSSVHIEMDSEEQAEKVVEKLKAYTRLKNKGAEFYGWRRNQTGTYELYLRWEDRIPRSYEVKNDLDLLFGGEDDK